MSELRSERGGAPKPMIFATLDDEAIANLQRVQQFYQEKTQKHFSRSVLIRRALAVLSDHLTGVNTPIKETREVTALLMVR
jgi:hypothetical protein